MNKKLAFLLVVVLLVGALPLTFAQDEGTVTVIPAGETVKVGLATDLSNVLGAAGEGIRNGGQLAVDQFNEMNGLEGFQIELVVGDDRCDGADATNVANRFVAEANLVGVVGHACSGATIPASEIYEANSIVMVSPSATADAVVNRGLKVVNRVAFNDAVQGVVAARYIQEELEAESIAILHDNSDYGKGLADTVNATAEELGLEVVVFDAIDPDSQDYRPQLTSLVEAAPDVLYFGGYAPQAALLAKQMVEVGLDETTLFGADGVFIQDFLDLAGEDGEEVYASHGRAVEENADFAAAYEEAFDATPSEQGPYAEEAYDSAMVILMAIQKVAVVGDDGSLTIDRAALIDAVRETKDYAGLSGTITCSSTGECATPIIDVSDVEDGEWVLLETPDELQVKFE